VPLAEYFMGLFTRKYARPGLKLGRDTLKRISEYDWPGNVRELSNTLERAVLIAEGDEIRPEDLALEHTAIPAAGRLKDMERQAIIQALEETGGNRKQAARLLGISLRTLQYRLKEFGIT